jgi:streptogramin lyase
MRLSHFALSSLFLVSSLAITGCSGGLSAISFPDSSAQVAPGALHGSNYGGHAPIAGSHLFLLEATASSAGYGGKATSLLNSTASGAVEDLTGSATSNPTYGMYFVPTGTDGSFNISNEYTCSSGDPVYIYSQGGSPSSSTITTLVPTQVAVANGATGYQTITINATQNFVAGEPITLNDFPAGYSFSVSVLSAGLSGTQFEATIPTSLNVPNGTYSGSEVSTVQLIAVAGTNPQVVNTVMLGLCPGVTGEFAHTLSYVYMNEVSTTAMAYAMAGFATNTTTGVTQDATHIGAPSTTQALLGLQNAALNANQLYNIQGGNVGTVVGDGDAHIARLFTPNGNGIVPQAMLNTIANILAACVDSVNTYNPYATTPAGTQSTKCSTLFSQASSTGGASGGTAPLDTATAVFNIAHLPAGASANSTTFMTNLYSLQGTTYPFAPQLAAQPNDFTVAIQYPNSSTSYPSVLNPQVEQPESIGIDGSGNIWMNSAGNKYIFEMTPLGLVNYQSPAATYSYGYLSVDPSGNVWSGNGFSTSAETEFIVPPNNGGTTVTTASYYGPYNGNGGTTKGLYDAYATVTDSGGNAYIGAATTGDDSQGTLIKLTSAGVNEYYDNGVLGLGAGPKTGGHTPLNANPVGDGYNIAHGAVDGAGFVWLTTEGNFEIGRYDETTGDATFTITPARGGGSITAALNSPEEPAVDANNNLWVANQNDGGTGGSLIEVSPTGTVTTATGGTLNNPFATAIDGLGNAWVANRATSTSGAASSILEFSTATAAAISPTTNYTLGGQVSHPLNMAVDPSGVLWITSYDSNMVVEMLGAAAPTATPLSYASGVGKLGARP